MASDGGRNAFPSIPLADMDRRLRSIFERYASDRPSTHFRKDPYRMWLIALVLFVPASNTLIMAWILLCSPHALLWQLVTFSLMVLSCWLVARYVAIFKERTFWPVVPSAFLLGFLSLACPAVFGFWWLHLTEAVSHDWVTYGVLAFSCFLIGWVYGGIAYYRTRWPWSEDAGDWYDVMYAKRFCAIDPRTFSPETLDLNTLMGMPAVRRAARRGTVILCFDKNPNGNHFVQIQAQWYKSFFVSRVKRAVTAIPLDLHDMIQVAMPFGPLRRQWNVLPMGKK